MGGLARKATILDNVKRDGVPTMVVDAGNLFFKKVNLVGVNADVTKMTAEIIRDAYNVIGCDGFSPGAQDFAGGLDFLLELESGAGFPFLSSNIHDKNGNKLFDSYRIINTGSKKVGLIGATSHFEHNDLDVSDPISSIDKIMDEVLSKSDIIILLFHASEADIKRLHGHNFPINLVVQSKNRRKSSDGGNNNTPVFSCGARGKYVYQFDLNIDNAELGLVDISPHENKIKIADKRLKRLKRGNKTDTLEEIYKGDINNLDLIKTLKEQKNQSEKIISEAINTLNYKEIPLDKMVDDRFDILKIVDIGKEKINQIATPQPAIPLNAPAISPRSAN